MSYCITDGLETGNNMVSGRNQFINMFIIFNVFINIDEYANYIICIIM